MLMLKETKHLLKVTARKQKTRDSKPKSARPGRSQVHEVARAKVQVGRVLQGPPRETNRGHEPGREFLQTPEKG